MVLESSNDKSLKINEKLNSVLPIHAYIMFGVGISQNYYITKMDPVVQIFRYKLSAVCSSVLGWVLAKI